MAFSYCVNINKIVFSNNLETISDSAFGYCTSLKTIDLPIGVDGICDYAFYGCTSLETITFGESGVTYWYLCIWRMFKLKNNQL